LNTWFQFKEFIIRQDKCAMKVCTDACLFGSWVADKISLGQISPKHILDIGSGTGLLSLMLAQKSTAAIDAVEIDPGAFQQASENITGSVWRDRIKIHHQSIIDFTSPEKYDLIISNPPFYENDLKSEDEGRNKAMHDTALSFENLAKAIKNHLSESGNAAVLLPFHRVPIFEKALNAEGLYVQEKMNVAHSPKHPFFRSLLMIGFHKTDLQEAELMIRNGQHEYDENFKFLLKDYYL
jgi:tRNA1Val (adenine37-N6)-methyltransferase